MARHRNPESLQKHREEMARRKGERAARVALSCDPRRVPPLLREFHVRREIERVSAIAAECAALRAVRARTHNFLGEVQQ